MKMDDRYVPFSLFLLMLPIIIATHFMMSVAFSSQSSPLGTVHLVATLNGNPALKPVDWVVHCDNNKVKPLSREYRHSATAQLAPSTYTAIAKVNGEEFKKTFTLTPGMTTNVIIPIDTVTPTVKNIIIN